MDPLIISRTPFRISFVGGGTDLEAYYQHGYGAVLSTAIQKYMYVTVNERFEDEIRVSYRQTELVDEVDEIEHDLVREAMRYTGVDGGVEVVTIGDVPGRGTGLGSSSSLTVGLLNALHAYRGEHASEERLAREACEIEIDILDEPIGKQDQYAAAYGGLNYIQFNKDGTVEVDPILLDPETRKALESRVMAFFTGMTRDSSEILEEQEQKSDEEKREVLDRMRDQAEHLRDALREGDLTGFGDLLHEGWELKKQLASDITNPTLDEYYEKARKAGARGGKISGAGGGGFFTLYVDPGRQDEVREALPDLTEMTVEFAPQGSKIIHTEEPR